MVLLNMHYSLFVCVVNYLTLVWVVLLLVGLIA